eukprot:TRINITY_DN41_c0_g1_i1.p1 TRINITY_DN41_c0_g1~~TRINITY_DN41_c0_g1_i1.p1  ORF type:complete len:126 (+),score=17.80 TRINITY_DN41_c0_g1_i1:115-492(+)
MNANHNPHQQQQQGYAPPMEKAPLLQQGQMPSAPVYQQPTVVAAPVPGITFRESAVRCTCQFCSSQVVTSTEYVNGTLTWLASGAICLFGCVLGCCLIPFALDSCKDVVHRCPSCRQTIAVYRRG